MPANILPHPSLSASDVDRICRREGLRLTQTHRGFVRFTPNRVLLEDAAEEFIGPSQEMREKFDEESG